MAEVPGPGWRADVRDQVAAVLSARIPEIGGRVFRARVWPITGAVKPCVLVYGYAEQKELVGQGGYQHVFRVTLNLVVAVRTENTASARSETECEALCRRIEQAVLRAPALFGPAGILERCLSVRTQLEAAQRDSVAEVEAEIEFQLVWSEVFTMAAPDTSECETATLAFADPAIPTP